MPRFGFLAAGMLLAAIATAGAGSAPVEETLRYNINWPSGLPLGETEISARSLKPDETSGRRWEFTLKLEAAIPGFAVAELHRSVATAELCSVLLEKQSERGKRKAKERTSFDLANQTAVRETLGGGGKSEFAVPACARDALAFLYFVRRELGQGRIPPTQTVYFGSAYEVRLEYGGRQPVVASESRFEADRLLVSIKGPASQTMFEAFFAVDPPRTPVLVRVPFAPGSFTMELVR